LGIATLIAAGRLDDSFIARVREALAAAAITSGEPEWIDAGDAADLPIPGDIAKARAVLAQHDGLDFVVRAGVRRKARLFVADMDSTIIGQECIDELADYAGFKAEVAAITERAMQGELEFASALAERVALLKGMDAMTLAKCRRARIRPNPGAATLVATMKAHGALTVLVSGGFSDFVRPIGLQLGFDRMRANALGVENQKLTGSTVGLVVDAAAKRRLAEEILAGMNAVPDDLVAIGDGANDVPMVELAGVGVGYYPKPALARVADGLIRFHDLSALLWMQGIPRRDWVSG
jgi:phosphoserine phosphatase